MSTPASGAVLAPGAGYGRPDGSGKVRALQRVLLGLGYASGPVDGLFGPRTRASLAWFQIKHGLPPTGIADAATLRVVRQRERARAGRPGGSSAPAERPAATVPAQRRAATTSGAPDRRASTDGGIGVLPLVLLLAAGAAVVSLLATVAWRRGRRSDLGPRARIALQRAWAKLKAAAAALTSSPRPASEPAPGGPSAIGYTRGGDPVELERHAVAIERACSERGWTLASIVREPASVAANGHTTPALALALDRLASGEASRLVTGRLDHLVRSVPALGRLLDWCTRQGVDLVAVDVGLDTSTRDGQLAARCLLAAGEGSASGEAAIAAGEPQPPQKTAAGWGTREARAGSLAIRRRFRR